MTHVLVLIMAGIAGTITGHAILWAWKRWSPAAFYALRGWWRALRRYPAPEPVQYAVYDCRLWKAGECRRVAVEAPPGGAPGKIVVPVLRRHGLRTVDDMAEILRALDRPLFDQDTYVRMYVAPGGEAVYLHEAEVPVPSPQEGQ